MHLTPSFPPNLDTPQTFHFPLLHFRGPTTTPTYCTSPSPKHYSPMSTTTSDTTVSDDDGIIDDPEWQEGDCIIVTTDKVRFQIPSYYLRSAIPDLLELAKGNSPPTMIFDDPEFETAGTLRAFLYLVVSGSCHIPDYTESQCFALAKFLDKWDCLTVLSHYTAYLKNALTDGELCPLLAFAIGAVTRDPEFCQSVLRTQPRLWPPVGNGQRSITDGTPGQSTFDPAHWPLFMWSNVHFKYAAALARAWGECTATNNTANLAETFMQYLQLALAAT